MSMAESPPFAADDSPPGFVMGRSLNILGKRVFLGDATFTRHASDWRGLGEPLLLYQQFERPVTGTPQGGNHLTLLANVYGAGIPRKSGAHRAPAFPHTRREPANRHGSLPSSPPSTAILSACLKDTHVGKAPVRSKPATPVGLAARNGN